MFYTLQNPFSTTFENYLKACESFLVNCDNLCVNEYNEDTNTYEMVQLDKYIAYEDHNIVYLFDINEETANKIENILDDEIEQNKLAKIDEIQSLKNQLEDLTDDTDLINLCLNNFETNGSTYLTAIQALEGDDSYELNKAIRIMKNASRRHNTTNYDQIVKDCGKELAREIMY